MKGFCAVLVVALALTSRPGRASSGSSGLAGPPCKYEATCNCKVPGITVRWNAAYCMLLNETDDLEQAGVQECLAGAPPPSVAKLGPCGQNAHWKRMICGAQHKGSRKQIDKCVRDTTMMPRFVAKGAGGGP